MEAFNTSNNNQAAAAAASSSSSAMSSRPHLNLPGPSGVTRAPTQNLNRRHGGEMSTPPQRVSFFYI